MYNMYYGLPSIEYSSYVMIKKNSMKHMTRSNKNTLRNNTNTLSINKSNKIPYYKQLTRKSNNRFYRSSSTNTVAPAAGGTYRS